MEDNKNHSEQEFIQNEQEEDALRDELLSVEKNDTKIKHISKKRSLIIVSVAILLIAALIAGFVLFGNNDNGEDENVKTLYEIEQTSISSIEIKNQKNNEVIKLTSFMNGSTQEWNLEGYKYDLVNQTNVSKIAQFCANLETKFVLDANEDKMAEYGLKNPDVTVTVTLSDGTKREIYLGSEYGSSEGVYLALKDVKEEIYIVNDFVRIYFSYALSDLLNLPSLSRTTTGAMTISVLDENRSATTLSYVPHHLYGTEAWYLIEPTVSQTESEAVDGYFENISNFTLNAYYADAVGKDVSLYGFDKPTLEMQSYDVESVLLDHFVVGKLVEGSEDTYYCILLGKDDKIEDAPVYTVKKDQLALLKANPVTLASPYLVALNINWLRGGKLVIDGKTYEITIDRKLQYDDEGKILYLEDGTENTKNTYYINGIKLDELQFKTFYSRMLFLYIEGIVPKDTPRGEEIFAYSLDVVIPVTDNETGVTENKELTYSGAYYKISETHAVLEHNQAENAVFTVRCRSIETVKEALGLLLEGRMPTA